MKNIYIIGLFIIGFSIAANAQNGLWMGASFGIQNTLLSSNTSAEIDTKNAFRPITTLDVEYRFNHKIALQTGLGYALYTQNTSKFKNNFNYLVIPLYIKGGKFKKENKYAFSSFFGINYKYLLAANTLYEGNKNDISEFTTKSHIDYAIGLGVKHKLSDNLLLESHLTGAYGGNFNNASVDGFLLTNFNYGVVFSLKYKISNK